MPKTSIKLAIKSRWTGSILFEYESENNTILETLLEALKAGADLYGADLRGADLRGANLYGADLYGAKNAGYAAAQTVIVPEGTLIGWKMARLDDLTKVIVKVRIPEEAKRSNASGRKCRAEFAEVLAVYPKGRKRAMAKKTIIHSDYTHGFTYKTGDLLKPTKPFNTDRWEECASGIHFFITREEAENY